MTNRAPPPTSRRPWYSLEQTFVMEPGRSRLPKPPITDKVQTEKSPALTP